MSLLPLVIAALACVASGQATRPQVTTRLGVVEGVTTAAEEGEFNSFKGIPFAKPPVGELRLKNPEPAEAWEGVLDASAHPDQCVQVDMLAAMAGGEPAPLGSEDCLYLNVFAPKVSPSEKLPVMVWIHGGGFAFGNISFYEPLSEFLQQGVVLVTVQYRLNIFGFLNSEDDVLRGNFGLKDQVMALRWVQDNIEAFGGDPGSVTIFGESAGGASVHYLVLSPMAKGLFHRAIPQSGVALNSWATYSHPRRALLRYGAYLGCPSDDLSALVACLRQATAADLIKAMYNQTVFMGMPAMTLPSVDGEFLPDEPAVLLREGRYNLVDMMVGVTEDEGSFVKDFFGNETLLRQNEFMIPMIFAMEDEEDAEYLAKRIVFNYVGGLDHLEDKSDELTKMFSDVYFDVGVYESLRYHLRDQLYGHRRFVYRLQHLAPFNAIGLFFAIFQGQEVPKAKYVMHGDDLLYLFDFTQFNLKIDRLEEKFMMHTMIKLWTNFAKFGNPTPDASLGYRWPEAKHDQEHMQALGLRLVPKVIPFENEHVEFFRELPTKNSKLMFPEYFEEDCKAE